MRIDILLLFFCHSADQFDIIDDPCGLRSAGCNVILALVWVLVLQASLLWDLWQERFSFLSCSIESYLELIEIYRAYGLRHFSDLFL